MSDILVINTLKYSIMELPTNATKITCIIARTINNWLVSREESGAGCELDLASVVYVIRASDAAAASAAALSAISRLNCSWRCFPKRQWPARAVLNRSVVDCLRYYFASFSPQTAQQESCTSVDVWLLSSIDVLSSFSPLNTIISVGIAPLLTHRTISLFWTKSI